MDKETLEEMSYEELASLGSELGELAKTRPDIVYFFMVGFHSKMSGNGCHDSARVMEWLWRHGTHEIGVDMTNKLVTVTVPSGTV